MDNKKLKYVINQSQKMLIDDLTPEAHILSLQENGVLTETDMEDIRAESTRSKKVTKMLEILKRKPAYALDVLIASLSETGDQPHLTDKLIKEKTLAETKNLEDMDQD